MTDEARQAGDGGFIGDLEPCSEIIPEGDTQLAASLDQSEESIATIAPGVASGAAADLALGHLAADVVFRAVGVQRNFGPVEDNAPARLWPWFGPTTAGLRLN